MKEDQQRRGMVLIVVTNGRTRSLHDRYRGGSRMKNMGEKRRLGEILVKQ